MLLDFILTVYYCSNSNNRFAKMNMAFIFILALLAPGLLAYDTSVALELAYMSAISYKSVDNIKAWNCDICNKYKLQNVEVFSKNNCQGFVGFSPRLEAIIISIRGTKNIQNWLSNANFRQYTYSRCNKCKVHTGFFNAYEEIKPEIIVKVQKLRDRYLDEKIYVTGHSLGGAIGVLAAPDIKEQIGNVELVLTFGQPKVGNKYYATWLGKLFTYQRVVHNNDIVPHLPLKKIGYQHGGSVILYNKGMQAYKVCDYGKKGCSVPLKSLRFVDHFMSNYLKLKVQAIKS